MERQLYTSIALTPNTVINQYIIPCKIHEEYTDLTCQGVCIELISEKYGGRAIHNSIQLDNVFCKYNDAVRFMEYIRANKTKPYELNEVLNKFISETYLNAV